MSVGLRVVRGPDWNLGDKDKGEGHVGTVVKDNDDGTYDVVWDMGERTTCRGGKNGKSDLIILDNAPTGIKHLSVNCAGCDKNTIVGILWKCTICSSCSLCTPCYLTDKHDLGHSFRRIDSPQDRGFDVPKRCNSTKIKALGLFPGASVVRGPDWEFGNQDGGKGKKGKVEDLRGYGSDVGGRNAVRVRWEANGEANVYKVGCRGKVDVKCISEGHGGFYYRDHLPVLGKTRPSSSSTAAAASAGRSGDTILKIGDKCVIDMPEDALKEVQKGHGGWSIRMSECVGEICTVKNFVGDSIIEVQYKDKTYQFYAGAVSKVHPVKLGDTVRINQDTQKCILLQKHHGGWNDDMKKAVGLVGKVVKIDSDGDVAVAFGNQAWVFNPALLFPAPGMKPDVLAEEKDFTSSVGDNPRAELSNSLARLMAHMLLLETLGRQQVGPQEMVVASAKGDLNGVKTCLRENKGLVNCKFKNVTPLVIAAHEGQLEVVKLLLANGARINDPDDKGNTALLAALSGKKEDVAILLVQNKADVRVKSSNGRTPAHVAAFEGLCAALKVILEKGCGPNEQDSDGDTALHDAISKRNDRAVAIILSHPHLDLTVKNKKDLTPLIWAAMKDHEFAVEKIIGKAPHLVNFQNKDRHSALHVAAVNDHQDVANLLLFKGKADVNACNNNEMTPLHLAAYEGYDKMVQILTQHGADLKMKDSDGDTPLHCAMRIKRDGEGALLQLLGLTVNSREKENAKFRIACHLLEKGANYQATNNQGATPLQVCPSERLKGAVIEVIKKRQRKPQQQAASHTANALNELFSELLTLPCAVCKENMSNVRFLPCRHKITCIRCCFRVNICPLCETEIDARCDMNGQRIVPDPCRVQ